MASITIAELRARHARLLEDRQRNQAQLDACQERAHGFRYVLGELESMIAELEQRTQQEQQIVADLAGLAIEQEPTA